MKLQEVFDKVGKDKIKEALECDDSEALQKLLNAHGVKLDDEQIDFIAGGRFLNADNELGCTVITPYAWE